MQLPASTPTTNAFEVLTHPLRWHTLKILDEVDTARNLAELAAEITETVSDESLNRAEERIERIQIALHHCHLPKLVDDGLIIYDQEARTVALGDIEHRSQLKRLMDSELSLV
ncbi:DUF7344 domain-containing protein [Haloprofundus salilacus]|uniref:DUF7344 domain-containing protein n=1 Tax=Haloprofundus salilacus TaxID=2876190 RepID=UPI001CC8F8A7|nr:hypothetical protein [Haloprofundus salilacus]